MSHGWVGEQKPKYKCLVWNGLIYTKQTNNLQK